MIRRTKQRLALLRVIEEEDRPLSANELYELARHYDERIGLRTVYRNIRELVEEGQLVGVDYPGQPVRYEKFGGGQHRPHFICYKCGQVYVLDVEVSEVTVATPPPGFEVSGDEVILYGTCAHCNGVKASPHPLQTPAGESPPPGHA